MARLYAANQFNFDQLVPWLRAHIAMEASE
jgi:hypothetical protein